MRFDLLPDGRILIDRQKVAMLSMDNRLTTIRGHIVQCDSMGEALQRLSEFPVRDWITKPAPVVPRYITARRQPTKARWSQD